MLNAETRAVVGSTDTNLAIAENASIDSVELVADHLPALNPKAARALLAILVEAHRRQCANSSETCATHASQTSREQDH